MSILFYYYHLLLLLITLNFIHINNSLLVNNKLSRTYVIKKKIFILKNGLPLSPHFHEVEKVGLLDITTGRSSMLVGFIEMINSSDILLLIFSILIIGYPIYIFNKNNKSVIFNHSDNNNNNNDNDIKIEQNSNFIFDDTNELINKDFSYLSSGILAGLNYLPPENILKKQTGIGRRVQYKQYQLLTPIWRVLNNIIGSDSPFQSVSVSDINRFIENDDVNGEEQIGSFRIYKMKIHRLGNIF
jgi:hypothetical protein